MTEEILEMGKPKTAKAKPLTRAELEEMFAKHDAELLKKIDDKCESCSHHECECPQKIEAADERMDRLDENDALIQGNVEKVYDKLNTELREERRLREVSDEEIKALAEEHKSTLEALAGVQTENRRIKSDNMKLGALAGLCLGVCLCVLAIAMAGLI